MLPLPETLVTAHGDGAAIANTTSQTSLLPAQAKQVVPTGALDRAGAQIWLRAAGRMSNIVTTPGTLTLELKYGSVVVASSGALSLNVVAKTNTGWWLDWMLTLRDPGAAATFMHQGFFKSHSVIGSPAPTAGGAGVHLIPYNAAPAVGTAFDSKAAQILDLCATWSIANSGNSIQLHQYAPLFVMG